MSSPLSYVGRGLRGFWRLLDFTRRALLNLLFLLILAAIVWALTRGGPPPLQPKTALVLDISGRMVEQRAGSTSDAALQRVRGGDGDSQTRLRDVLAVLDAAAKDPDITHALLLLDDLAGAGLPTLRELAAAVDRFKAAGKPVVAWGTAYDQRSYFLAAHATEVWVHPMGGVSLQGYGRLRSYYKDLLDRIGVQANVIRAGQYKNANETLAASGPSQQTLEADGALFNALWSSWTGNVEQARKLPAGSVMQAIDSLPQSLVESGGDLARWSIDRKLVDALKTRDEVRDAFIERGARDEKTFRQIGFGDYLSRLKPQTGSEAVGVIVAEGEISDGQAGPGSVGGESTAQLVRAARDNDKIKALVVRVNSPGGSVLGSELVRRELELTRKAGKPVVVSMGDLAASGGYWLAMASDEVIADETTITGSIGVISMIPTVQGAFDKLGIHTGGASTTWLATARDLRRDLDPRFVQLVQTRIDAVYRDFTTKVAAARKTTPEKINEVAQGRVWAGKDALANGLVDRLGSYGDALKAAATRAKLAEGWRVEYVEAQPGKLERLLLGLGMSLGAELGSVLDPMPAARRELQGTLAALGLASPAAAQLVRDLGTDLAWMADIRSGRELFTIAAHCLCTVP